ncbi:MAG: AsmA-like C-terminal region-containing protein [Lentisphaeria bacterium]|nr:AsmA-like C-terminal region-containing protein [Lentisphaeria bacterium]
MIFLFGRHFLLTWVLGTVAEVTFDTPVGMGEASFVPTRRLDLSDLRIGDPENAFLTVGPVEARYRLWRSLFLGTYIERFHAEGLTVNLAQTPKGKIKVRSHHFRWFRRFRHKEDIEDNVPFLLKDISLRNGTLVYARDDSPFRLRIENLEMTLGELRQGDTGRIESRGEVVEVAYGPLRLVSGQVQGFCELRYDREMDLQGSEFSFTAEDLSGTFGGVVFDGLTLVVAGTTQNHGRGFGQDVQIHLSRRGQALGSVSLVGYFAKNLARLDLTARVGIEADLANWLLAGWNLPPLEAPRFELAARGHFPRPDEAEVSLAANLELGGQMVADLDFSTRSPLPPVFQPARFRVTGERLDLDRLMAVRRALRKARRKTAASAPAETETATAAATDAVSEPVPLPQLVLPPALLDLDLRGVSFGNLAGALVGQAAVQGTTAEISSCRLQSGEGTLDLAGRVDWETEAFRANIQGRSLDFSPFSQQFLAADAGRIEGRLESLSAEFSGRGLGEPDWTVFAGTFQAELEGLAFQQLEALREAARKTNIKGLDDLRFDRASLVGHVAGGRLHLAPLALHGPSGRAELAGQIGLVDQSLALTLEAGLGPDLAKGLRGSAYSYLALLLQPRDGYMSLPVPLSLGGTLSQPKLSLEPQQPNASPPL